MNINIAKIPMYSFSPSDYIGKVFIYLGGAESKEVCFCKVITQTSSSVYIRPDDRDGVIIDCTFRTICSTSLEDISCNRGTGGYITKRSLDSYWKILEETDELLFGNKR